MLRHALAEFLVEAWVQGSQAFHWLYGSTMSEIGLQGFMLGALGPNSFYVFELHGSYVSSTTNPRPQATNSTLLVARYLGGCPKFQAFSCLSDVLSKP